MGSTQISIAAGSQRSDHRCMRLRASAGWLILGLSSLGCQEDVVWVEPEDITYFAEVRDSSWVRVHVLRVDHSTNTCTRVALRQTDSTSFYFYVDAPMNWVVEFARVYPDTDCLGGDYVASAVAGTGVVEFPADYDSAVTVYPCTVDVDATF